MQELQGKGGEVPIGIALALEIEIERDIGIGIEIEIVTRIETRHTCPRHGGGYYSSNFT